jgi:hypothetical protein
MQEELFSSKKLKFKKVLNRAVLSDLIIKPHDLLFDHRRVKKNLRRKENVIGDEKTPVYTHERLSGNPHSGGYDSKQIADRLKKVIPDAKILIVIREQESMILSTYFQYVKIGGTLNIDDYINPMKDGWGRVPMFNKNHLKYHLLIQYYESIYGKKNVLVLPFELFVNEPKNFIHRIISLCERGEVRKKIDSLQYNKKKNESQNGITLSIERQLNKLFARDRINPGALFPSRAVNKRIKKILRMVGSATANDGGIIEKYLRSEIKKHTKNFYRKSNNKLTESMEISIGQYEYQLPKGKKH